MIMQGDTPRGLTRAGALATIGLALVLLPWRPTRAQQDPVKPAAPGEGQVEAVYEIVKDSNADAFAGKTSDDKVPRIDQAEARIRAQFLQTPEVAKLVQRIGSLDKLIEAAKADLGNDDPSTISKLQSERTDVARQFNERWLEAYPRLKSRMGDPSDIPATLRADLQRAKDRLTWTEQMKAKGLLSQAEFSEAMAQLARVEAQIEDERKAREAAPKKTAQEVRLVEAQIAIRRAMLSKAEAQRELARTEFTRLEGLGKKGVGFVTESEMNRAKAEMAVADALVAEAAAYVAEAQIMLENAIEQGKEPGPGDRLGIRIDQAQKAFRGEPDKAREPNHRIDELESKLDAILKDLEALKKAPEVQPAGDAKP